MAKGYSIPITFPPLTSQQRADLMLAEWQRLRSERGIKPGQWLVMSEDDLDVFAILFADARR
jgi:hypothetical protein